MWLFSSPDPAHQQTQNLIHSLKKRMKRSRPFDFAWTCDTSSHCSSVGEILVEEIGRQFSEEEVMSMWRSLKTILPSHQCSLLLRTWNPSTLVLCSPWLFQIFFRVKLLTTCSKLASARPNRLGFPPQMSLSNSRSPCPFPRSAFPFPFSCLYQHCLSPSCWRCQSPYQLAPALLVFFSQLQRRFLLGNSPARFLLRRIPFLLLLPELLKQPPFYGDLLSRSSGDCISPPRKSSSLPIYSRSQLGESSQGPWESEEMHCCQMIVSDGSDSGSRDLKQASRDHLRGTQTAEN